MNCTREWARQFAYDDPRARFMDRDANPRTLPPINPQSWTD